MRRAIDCRVYARAASIALGIDRWPESKWESLVGEKAKKSKKEQVAKREKCTVKNT
ncbi:MAG: hypothetical protein ACEY3M_12300 [Wolbachia sp.]